jgi:hypothetical protein
VHRLAGSASLGQPTTRRSVVSLTDEDIKTELHAAAPRVRADEDRDVGGGGDADTQDEADADATDSKDAYATDSKDADTTDALLGSSSHSP